MVGKHKYVSKLVWRRLECCRQYIRVINRVILIYFLCLCFPGIRSNVRKNACEFQRPLIYHVNKCYQ
jgi:hypothetical protein